MRKNGIATMILLGVACVAGGCGDSLAVQGQSHKVKLDAPIKRVAVVDFAGDGGQAIADMLTMHLMKAGYEVVERQYLSDLFRGAINPSREGQTDEDPAERLSKIGRALNADAIGHCILASQPTGAGMARAVAQLGLAAVLDLGLSYGEGVGAALAAGVVKAAAQLGAGLAEVQKAGGQAH